VDGALFVNLSEEEYQDLGIKNRFHLRKLQLIMKGYRTRYERRKDRKHQMNSGEEDDEEDLISEYAPSELSALIAAENEDESTVEDEFSDEVHAKEFMILYLNLNIISIFIHRMQV